MRIDQTGHSLVGDGDGPSISVDGRLLIFQKLIS
jgi:hypothetical protein